MVAPLVAAAGISAVGSLIGGITGGKGAKKAAQIQQQTTQQQIAATNAMRQQITGLEQPTIDRGDWAGSIYSGLLGQGDGAASKAAIDTWRGSTGYQDLIDTGLKSVNANAYASGMGDSGATLKRLQAKGMSLADQNQQTYLGNLGTLIGYGRQAVGNISGVAQNATAANNNALQNGADANSNAALISSSNWQQALKNIINAGQGAMTPGAGFASSYGGGVDPGRQGWGGATNPPWAMSYGINPRFA